MASRRTQNQQKILEVLQGLKTEISAQDLYIELRKQQQSIGLATVYRSLEALKLSGHLQVRTLASGESLYSAHREDRHHLTCLRCHTSIAIDECPVHALEKDLQQTYGFGIFYHTLEFFGLCESCQAVKAG
ncbi:Fur family transcriptional regulator [Synechococcus elongatus]|uniref:Transcriptional repressor n=2 Tax=Synechococcus elongatus TaxID=32046 RepID=A0AAN1QQ92_SYNEL|nr:transcriptional repressor [Synechococcus elongatus]AZB73413.1 transcriptional repressor [Synechococcus elongatus PCC 11801]QFZ93075.1 transcriptional repressor [Synechococcus elongatus PCC 11802]